jgi:hypothetical protein
MISVMGYGFQGQGHKASEEFGKEGTNKTLPQPKDDNTAPEELGHTRHIEKSPYTRG